MSKQSLNRFEQLAQRLVEGSLGRLLGGRLELVDVGNQLAAALEDGQREGQAPDLYYVRLHPDDYLLLWQEHSDLGEKLADFLVTTAVQTGLSLPSRPLVDLSEDEALTQGEVAVKALHSEPVGRQGETQIRTAPLDDNSVLALQTVDAFLIIQGRRHVLLDRPVINLGRRVDNDIVIDSPAVSRQHAQLRWRYGRFVLYDLGSRAGTMVNGVAITEAALQPGDLISLSDVTLIYGEGLAEENGRRPRSAQVDEITAVMERPAQLDQIDNEVEPPGS
jgi:pSer/pThr/pTyr-binding forkhead associated (FHA) protein